MKNWKRTNAICNLATEKWKPLQIGDENVESDANVKNSSLNIIINDTQKAKMNQIHITE